MLMYCHRSRTEVDQDGVDPTHAIEERGQIVVMVDLGREM